MTAIKTILFSLVFAGICLTPVLHVTAQTAAPAPAVSAASPQVPTVRTPTEKEHIPVIRVPEVVGEGELFFANVQVGEGPHEMKADHRIEWIEGFVDGKMLFHLILSPLFTEPRLNIPIRIQHEATLKIEAHCSVHGTWGTEVHIRTQMPAPAV